MHYTAWAFAKDKKKPTIVPKNGASLNALGQSNGFSESDVTGLNKLFCKDTCYVDKYETEFCQRRRKELHGNGKECGDWMKKNCAKTCEVCRTETTCKDGTDTVRCKKYAGAGYEYCEKSYAREWMTKWCAKSCGICKP